MERTIWKWKVYQSLPHYGLMTTYGALLNTDSGNGSLLDVTKPLPEPMLTYQR